MNEKFAKKCQNEEKNECNPVFRNFLLLFFAQNVKNVLSKNQFYG